MDVLATKKLCDGENIAKIMLTEPLRIAVGPQIFLHSVLDQSSAPELHRCMRYHCERAAVSIAVREYRSPGLETRTPGLWSEHMTCYSCRHSDRGSVNAQPDL